MLSVKGKSTTDSTVLKIDFDAALLAVDDVLRPEAIDDFIAPGLIDLQVNGFAGWITTIPPRQVMPLQVPYRKCSPRE